MIQQLKNCPFCGNTVQITKSPLWVGNHGYKNCYEFKVICDKCGCTRTFTKTNTVYDTEEDAINNTIIQWNMRYITTSESETQDKDITVLPVFSK